MNDVVNRIEQLPPRILEFLVRCTQADGRDQERIEMIIPRDRSGPCPLSYAQERLWFLDQLQPGNVAYNLPLLMPLGNKVDLAVLERALNEVVARHESLRTTFGMVAGAPAQRIAPSLRVGVEETDLRGMDEPQQRLQLLINEEAARPFDLQRGPLLRAKLIRAPSAEALLLLNMHHIISDGWSLGVLVRELRAAYEAFERGLIPSLKQLGIQYADYAAWQREWLRGERLAEELRYGRQQLEGAPPLLELACDYPRPTVESYRGAVQTFGIPAHLVAPLRDLAHQQQATLFMVLLSVFKALLARYSNQSDIVVGSPIANRNRAELEDLIGFFVNMLVLRTEVDEELSVRQLVERVRAVTLKAYEHQDLPFEKLVEELHLRRSLSHSSVFQVAFVLQNTPQADRESHGAEITEPRWDEEPAYLAGTAKFDLTLYLEERGEGLVVSCEYRTDLFGHETIKRMMRRYVSMLEAAGADANMQVCQLPVETGEEEPPVGRAELVAAEPLLIERVGLVETEGWEAEGLTIIGREVSALLGLDEASRLAVLDARDEVVLLLGQVAGAAAGAVVWAGEAAQAAIAAQMQSTDSTAAPTHLLLTPEALAALDPADISPGVVMVVVGLPWFAASMTGWEQRPVVGLWASNEGALCCATLEMGEIEAVISEPLSGCRVEVLDERLRRQPLDLWGTLYIAGAAARSGLGGSDWVDAPLANGGRLYKTGLVGRRRPDGKIEVAGADSRMLRIDGMRVDPQRLESLLRQHSGVEQATVKVQAEGEESYTVAWVVRRSGRRMAADAAPARAGGRVSGAELMRYVSERLTAGLVPRQIVFVEELPHSDAEAVIAATPVSEEPRTAAEAVIARIWSEVLGAQQQDIHANFFDRGGNSVSSVQVISRIREALHVELPLHRLFESPTIAGLASFVEADPGFSSANLEDGEKDKVESMLERTCSLLDIQIKGLDEEGILDLVAALEDWEVEELLQRTFRQVRGNIPSDTAKAQHIRHMTRERRRSLLTKLLVNHFGPVRNCPLSYAQERLWFLDQLQPGNVAYNIPFIVPLDAKVDLAVLERTLNEIVNRHDALRATFTMMDGSPVQRISPSLRIPIEEIDLCALAEGHSHVQRIFNEEAWRPFDLQRGPLLRAKLIRAPSAEALLLLNMHHIISDGWSLGVLVRELRAAYEAFERGLTPSLKQLGIQYADYAAWQREWLRGERLEAELKYGRELLAGAPPLLELPCDRPRPAVESYRGTVQTFAIPGRVVGPLRELARREQATLFMVALAMFQALLARYSGRSDVVVGSPVANRGRAELEDLIGFFVNMLALRTEVGEGLSVRELIGRVRAAMLEAYEHQDMPFEKLVEELRPRRSLTHSPVFQVAFVLQNTPPAERQTEVIEIGEQNWEAEPAYLERPSKFDLTLYLEERGDGLMGSCEYRTDLFEHSTMSRMMQRYVRMLEAAGADADVQVWQLPIAVGQEPAVVRRAAAEADPSLVGRVAKLAPAEWDAKGLTAMGREVAAWLGLNEASRLAVLDEGDEGVLLIGQAAGAAAGATVWTGTADKVAQEAPTHILLWPEALARLRPEEVGAETLIAVVGLPWFAASMIGWEQRPVVGVWVVSEGALCCAALEIEETEAVIGEPLAGCWIEVLDQRLRRQAVDLWGEVYVGGVAVSRAQLAGAWIADAFAAGGRLYKTGLVGRRRADGKIEVAGAEARMVLVDGMRVDPNRLESLLRQHRGVEKAVVRAQFEGDEAYLVAWVVRRAEQKSKGTQQQSVGAGASRQSGIVSEAELLGYVSERLTAGLVPRRIVIVEELPQSDDESVMARTRESEEPRTPAEAVIARIWSEVLSSPQRDVHANFFDRGGNSVASVQVVSRIREALHVELPLHRLFESPTIAGLASLVESKQAGSIDGTDAGEAGDVVSDGSSDVDWSRMDKIRRAPPGPSRSRAPLSYAQERLWFLDQFEHSSTLYNMAITVQMDAAADPKIIRRVLKEIIRRHEVLRTSFPSLGGLPQQVVEAAEPVPMPVTVLNDVNPHDTDAEVARIAANEASQPFDLSRGPVLRARLIRAGERYCCLSLVIHHIVFDGWSFGLLMSEFWTLYRSFTEGKDSPLEDLPVQYTDFARWQRRWLAGERFESHMEYWRQQLAGAPEVLNLPSDRARPPVETHRGATQWFSIPQREAAALRALSRTHGTTLFCVLLAAFKVLLMRLSDQEDFIVGAPIANRTRVEVEKLIGFFANTLALRTDLSGNPTFIDLLGRVHRVFVAASEHQEIPFEKIVEELQPERSLNHNPLFQVMLVLQNTPESLGGLREYAEAWQQAQQQAGDSEAEVIYGTSKFDITLTVIETESGIVSNVEYSTDLFNHSTIARMIRQFRRVLAAVISDPHCRIWQLPLMTPEEEAELVRALSGTKVARIPNQTVRDLFERQVQRTPSALALISGDLALSYETLNATANRLARRLMRLGVAPGDRVSISMPRGPELLAAVLAVIKAGAAYVPIDPSYPEARQSFMLADSRAALLIYHDRSRRAITMEGARTLELISGEVIAPEESEENLNVPIGDDDIAYVIFTSGSTGKPKGVMMRHGALANLILWQLSDLGQETRERTLQFTSLSFDVSFQELFLTWSTGGTLIVIDEETRMDPEALLLRLSEERVERLFMPYVALQQFAEIALDAELPLPPLREIITAGEQLRITPAITELFRRLEGCILRNQYGPTETHVVTEFVLRGDPRTWPSLPPIGKPIANVSVRILDRYLNPVSIGVGGEIYLAGECLALGYLGRPEQTAERFLSDRWNSEQGAHMYRTGDLGRMCADGNIEFLGRADHQMKIRGYRIEPAEIELTLTQIPEVEEAVVVAFGDSGSDKRLAAFVQGRFSADEDTDFIRDFLACRLPEYMVPSIIVAVESLPLTPSGKIDRQALLRSTLTPNRAQVTFEQPSTPLERMLAEHWSELLGIEHVGVNDSFFSLGGHSLLATRVISRVRTAIGLQLPVRSLFEAPTIRQLARIIARQIADRVSLAQSEELLTKLSYYSAEHAQMMEKAPPSLLPA